jgi:hypothetical protein
LPRKISVYVDEDLHRALKVAASSRGVSLSDFMVSAARRAIYSPSRKEVAARMDAIRESVTEAYSVEDIRSLREEGRRN